MRIRSARCRRDTQHSSIRSLANVPMSVRGSFMRALSARDYPGACRELTLFTALMQSPHGVHAAGLALGRGRRGHHGAHTTQRPACTEECVARMLDLGGEVRRQAAGLVRDLDVAARFSLYLGGLLGRGRLEIRLPLPHVVLHIGEAEILLHDVLGEVYRLRSDAAADVERLRAPLQHHVGAERARRITVSAVALDFEHPAAIFALVTSYDHAASRRRACLSRSHARHFLLSPYFPSSRYVLPGVYSWPCGQCVFLAGSNGDLRKFS